MAEQEKITQMARELETLKAAIKALTKGKNAESSSTSTLTESSKELCINPPKPFTGNRSQLSDFINALEVYFAINEGSYNSGAKKIGFALSFLEGNASSWKTAFIQSHTTNGTLNLGTYTDFLIAIKKDFEEVDKKGDAIYKLQHLKQGNKHAEELVSDFRVLAHLADLIPTPSPGATSSSRSTSDISSDLLLQTWFKDALNRPLLEQIMLSESEPTTLEEWFDKAIRFDAVWRRSIRALGNFQKKKREDGQTLQARRTEVNTQKIIYKKLTPEERTRLIAEGRCLYCREQGHFVADCTVPRKPLQNQPRSPFTPRTPFVPKTPTPSGSQNLAKPDPRFAAKAIRNLTADFTEEEQDQFNRYLEEGF
jgi:hypothetical protein